MGFSCELAVGPAFVYRAEDPAGRGVEFEYDILLTGTAEATPNPDPSEVAAWEWVDVDALALDLRARPERYAPWLHRGLPLLTGAAQK
jgi:isopentenyl-diphosphate delta-isomerase